MPTVTQVASGSQIASTALKYQGARYVSGGAPGTTVGRDNGTDCVAGGALVQTSRGAVPIESVRLGDMVTAWQDGKAIDAPVSAVVAKGARECLKIRMRNRTVIVTPDHRIPVLRSSRVPGPRRVGGRGSNPNSWRVEWTPAREVARGDYAVTMARVPESGTALSPDLAWLAGLFTGDGDFPRDRTVRICVYGELRDRARAVVAREFSARSTDSARHGLIIHSALAHGRLAGLGCVTGSAAKRIPEAIWTADATSRAAFLNGYIDADGHRGSKGTALHSCSPELIAEARMLAIGLGWNVGNIARVNRTRPIVIQGKTVKNARALYSFTIYEGRNNRGPGNTFALDYLKAGKVFADDFFTCERVLAVTQDGMHEVYDLTVPGPENFTADGVLVHNCSGFVNMVIGRDLGMAIPSATPGGYNGGAHGPVVAQWASWTGATTLPKGQAPSAGDLCVWNGLGPLGHIGIALDGSHMISALNSEDGTILSPIQGYGPPGAPFSYRRINGTGGAVTDSAVTTGILSPLNAVAQYEFVRNLLVPLGIGAGVSVALIGGVFLAAALVGLAGAALIGAAIRSASE